jgi:anaphase-promoting complex subunit 4
VDVLLAGFEDGTIHLRIFDCFEIGSVSLISSLPTKSPSCKLLGHAFHPMTSTHALVVQAIPLPPERDPTLHILALDLNFIPATAPYYLPILASKSTQLQNLLRYLAQIQTQLAFEVKSAFELPSKYLRNINESLAEHADGAGFVTAAYHLIVTGECIPQLREWLVDEVGERGLKRWEKCVLVGLETMRRIVHECLLPALERFQVVLSRLEGLSRFQRSAAVLGLDIKALAMVRDTVGCLNLLGHDLLKVIGKEVREFTAFLKWLRLETEIQGLEIGSERAEELREGSDAIEYRVVLDYVSGTMGRSGTLKYLQQNATDKQTDTSSTRPQIRDDSGYYDAYKKARESPEAGRTMPKLDDLVQRLKRQCTTVFDRIAETLRKSILHSYVCGLSKECDPEVMDTRIIPSQNDPDIFDVHIITKHIGREPNIYHTRLRGRKSGSSVANIRQFGSRLLLLPDAEEVRDIKFVDDTEFMVLVSGKQVSRIDSQAVDGSSAGWRTRHIFQHHGPAAERPARLEVNGRKGRRAVCVLDEQRTQYTIFDLDNSALDDTENMRGSAVEDDIDHVMTG